MTKADSSNLEKIGYDGANEALYVEFKSGKRYRYDGVPRSVWDAFQVATSLGKFLNAEIKPNYSCEPLPDDDNEAMSFADVAVWQLVRPQFRRPALF